MCHFIRNNAKVVAVCSVVFVHVLPLIYSASIHSPTNGEIPALSAGIYHWQTGKFNLFRVNPPLVRMVAALPVIAGINLQEMPMDQTTPGWYVIGVNKLYRQEGFYLEFRSIEPTAKAGKSIYIWKH